MQLRSIDLIYLDPPSNSNADYNVLFEDESGRAASEQILAYGDTWHWGHESELALTDLLSDSPACPLRWDANPVASSNHR